MSADRGAWADAFAGIYRHARCRQQERRARRRYRRREPSAEAVAARKAKLASAQACIDFRFAEAQQRPDFTASLWDFIQYQAKAGDPDAKLLWRAECQPVFAERRRQRQAIQQAEVRQRLGDGFRWHGGAIGGNPRYDRAPFISPGLISDRHPIFKLFVASTPRAAKLLTGDSKGVVSCVGQKLLSLDSAYVDTNRDMRRVLRVELDRSFSGGVEQLAAAIAGCGVPMPNFIVGHCDRSGNLLHPHLIWLIRDSVAFTGKGHAPHQKLWRSVLHGLTAALLPVGADPGGLLNPLRVKNPLSPLWYSFVRAEAPYTLNSDSREGAQGLTPLVPSLDLSTAWARLQAAGTRQRNPVVAHHPDPAIASQSNVVFRHLSKLARDHVVECRDQGRTSQEAFLQELISEALRMDSGGNAAAKRHLVRTATSVANWTWEHYRLPAQRPRCASADERRTRQVVGQTVGAAKKRDGTLAKLTEVARDLWQGGHSLTQTAVAAVGGRGVRTVRHHWPAILNAMAAYLR